MMELKLDHARFVAELKRQRDVLFSTTYSVKVVEPEPSKNRHERRKELALARKKAKVA